MVAKEEETKANLNKGEKETDPVVAKGSEPTAETEKKTEQEEKKDTTPTYAQATAGADGKKDEVKSEDSETKIYYSDIPDYSTVCSRAPTPTYAQATAGADGKKDEVKSEDSETKIYYSDIPDYSTVCSRAPTPTYAQATAGADGKKDEVKSEDSETKIYYSDIPDYSTVCSRAPTPTYAQATAGADGKKDEVKSEDSETKIYYSDIPDYSTMRTLSEFGYEFNEGGELREVGTDRPFRFDWHAPGRAEGNQKRYEALGDVITEHIYGLLENEGLHRIVVPSFFFASDGWEKAESLLVLIHGSGAVRAGQWARRLIINDCLDSGTQLPYIRKALQRGWAVAVLNTNHNLDKNTAKRIPENGSPPEHGRYVWDQWIRESAAKRIAIVAHSAGGWVTGAIAREYSKDFTERVKAVALTDSFCDPHPHITLVGRNWVTSTEPLNTRLWSRAGSSHVAAYSAGTKVHEESSYACMEPLWKFLDKQMSERGTKRQAEEADKTASSSESSSSQKYTKKDPSSKKGSEKVDATKKPSSPKKGNGEGNSTPNPSSKKTEEAEEGKTEDTKAEENPADPSRREGWGWRFGKRARREL